MSVSVRTLLNEKGSKIWAIKKDATVFEALQKMAEKDIGSLLVMDKGILLGIFTERDYARKGILQGRANIEELVSEFMTTNVITVTPVNTIDDCMMKMQDNNLRHLPVIEKGELLGVLSIKDVLCEIITQQRKKINVLEHYKSVKGYGADFK